MTFRRTFRASFTPAFLSFLSPRSFLSSPNINKHQDQSNILITISNYSHQHQAQSHILNQTVLSTSANMGAVVSCCKKVFCCGRSRSDVRPADGHEMNRNRGKGVQTDSDRSGGGGGDGTEEDGKPEVNSHLNLAAMIHLLTRNRAEKNRY